MTIQRLKCPKCRTAVNVPPTMASVRCPNCGQIWKIGDDSASEEAAESASTRHSERGVHRGKLAVAVAAVLVAAATAGGVWWWLNRDVASAAATPSAAADAVAGKTRLKSGLPGNRPTKVIAG